MPAPTPPPAVPMRRAVLPDPPPGPLMEGDRTTAERFRASLRHTPRSTRAELLRGSVRLNQSPPSPRRAALADALAAWARQYEVETPGVVRAAATRITLSRRSEVFADVALYVPADGRCAPALDPGESSGGGRLIGPPALVLSVAETDRGHDLLERLDVLREAGVTEFVIAAAVGGLQWYRLDQAPERPGRGDGCLKSAVLPGLWLPEAVLDPDPARVDVVAAVRTGCATLEHALFVNGLCSRKPR